ncbi:MAG: hypothetical protein DRI95_04975 [Bacteroidetes bacterium]|nr:MAG: hypothetical protein DRI95_04975 [Bacteroidota bacterium]
MISIKISVLFYSVTKRCYFVPLVITFFIYFLFSATLMQSQQDIGYLKKDTITNFKNRVYKIGLPIVPGLMYRDKKGVPKGFPVEIIHFILTKEDIRFEWVDGSWNELFTKLKNAEIDILPGTQVTEERKQFIDYVNTSLNTQWSELYILKEINFESIEDLYLQKIGFVKGDNNVIGFIDYFSKFKIKYQPVEFDSHQEGMEKLRSGDIYALVGPSPNSVGDDIQGFKSAGIFYNPIDNSYALPKGKNQELSKLIDKNVQLLKNDPSSIYFQLLDKYDLTNYRNKKWKVPRWIRFTFGIAIIIIIASVIFIFLLRIQVNKKTQIIRERESLLREAMEIGEIGAWVYTFEKDELFWSDEIYHITGIKKKKGKLYFAEMRTLIHPDDQRHAVIYPDKSIKQNEKIENEYRLIRKDGMLVYIKQIATIEKDENGKPIRVLGVIQNINKQKKHEHDLIKAKEKAEKSEKLKSAFLANMSHEIRTPLNAIVGFSSLLAEEGLDSEQKTSFRNIIIKQNDLLLTLISDILDLSKIESGNMDIRPKKIDAIKLIDEIYSSYIHLCPLEIKLTKNYNGTPDDFVIIADYNRLRQILINFISNAFKYTKKGKIEIGCKVETEGQSVKLYVKDTGIGLSNKEQKKVFTPFKQIDHMAQGTGLGLSISKSLADLMNMEISVKSEKGKGSEFYVLIPIAKNQQ